ncbi:MAG TPA: rhomboid family intramembrane serine protease [Caulobacteraceae bacterium]
MSEEDRPAGVGPWGAPLVQDEAAAGDPPKREPIFNAPWPALAIVVVIVGAYGLQSLLAPGDAGILAWGFAPADLDQGRWLGLVTVMFVHGGWAHALMNALAALAFGPPVARLMGPGWKGPLLFFLFYLSCGIVSTLGYTALHLHSTEPVVGASGAISGLMGAAARLLGPEARPISPIWSRPVISMGSSWLVVNALMAVFGGPLMGGARIAWEAHIAGFVAGVLLIAPFARLAGWRRIARM